MLVNIITKFSLDSQESQGKKNLELLLIASGLRSQVDLRSVTRFGDDWQVELYLERPEFWGPNLEFLRDDIENLVIYYRNTPTSCRGLVDFSKNAINTGNNFGDDDESPDVNRYREREP